MINQVNDVLGFHQKALALRAYRQEVLASNIANADTPGYVARDIDFKQAMAEASSSQTRLAPSTAGTTRAHPVHFALPGASGHIDGTPAELGYTVQTQPAMDNNTVDLDRERANFVDNAVRYESTLRFINGYSRTILSAIQGQ